MEAAHCKNRDTEFELKQKTEWGEQRRRKINLISIRITDEKYFKRVPKDDPSVLPLVRAGFDNHCLFLPHRHRQFVSSAFFSSLPSSQLLEEKRSQQAICLQTMGDDVSLLFQFPSLTSLLPDKPFRSQALDTEVFFASTAETATFFCFLSIF